MHYYIHISIYIYVYIYRANVRTNMMYCTILHLQLDVACCCIFGHLPLERVKQDLQRGCLEPITWAQNHKYDKCPQHNVFTKNCFGFYPFWPVCYIGLNSDRCCGAELHSVLVISSRLPTFGFLLKNVC